VPMSVLVAPYTRRTLNARRALPAIAGLVAFSLVATACGSLSKQLQQLRSEKAILPTLQQTSLIFDDHGRPITALHYIQNRTIIPFYRMPLVIRNAVVSIEDARFYDHHGVDAKALFRAAIENLRSGHIVQGGSTITEQLVKNTITGDDRTISRKLREAVLAYELESRLTKSQILRDYLNTVYFGQGAYGIQAAARTFFSRQATQLSLPQAATLAGLIASPSSFDPAYHPDAARVRRDIVLSKMRDQAYISPEAYAAAASSPLGLHISKDAATYPAAYFVEYVKQWFLSQPRFGKTRDIRRERLLEGGLRIYTTIDLGLQKAAENAVNDVLLYKTDPYGALTAIDPTTGAIRAMVGGRDFFATGKSSPFAKVNLATGGTTGRPAGSAFKPFALVAALENGFSPQQVYPAPPHIDIPLPPGSPTPVWPVDNYDGESFKGTITIEQGTISSVNTVYAQIVRDLGAGNPNVGAQKIIDAAYRMGPFPKGSLQPFPSAVLGTNPVNTLWMASAYGTLATMGKKVAPTAVVKITDATGHLIYQPHPQPQQVLNPGVAWEADQILQKVISQGTGTAANIGRPEAGKTGTGQQWRNAWFVGFVPQLVTAVWVGFPQGEIDMVYPRVRISHVLGGTWPAQIWHDFMLKATAKLPPIAFPQPPNIQYVYVTVDITHGCVASQFTPPANRRTLPFVKGTEPTKLCDDKPQNVVIPSVVGLKVADAKTLLQSSGFKVATKEQKTDTVPNGTVLAQDPTAGTIALQGTTVTLTVAKSSGPTPTPPPPGKKRVPNVVGMDVKAAANLILQAGFAVFEQAQWSCRPHKTCGAKPNQVWAESPAGGSYAPDNATITITYNPPH